MRKILFLLAVLLPGTLAAQCSSKQYEGSYSGGQFVVALPDPITCYNGNVILFAHGYVPVGSSSNTWKSQLMLPDGTSIPSLVNSLGFGFAASGFSKDGLAIPEGMQDTKALIPLIQQQVPVQKVFITGASEGGLIAAKLMEADTTFNGGVAVCGPIGDFRKQVNYLGDGRVLFDYFFPGVLPGDLLNVAAVKVGWLTTYEQKIRNAVNSKPLQTLQLLSVANIPIGLNAANAADAIIGVIWYDVFGIDDLIATLGGKSYDNIGRVYRGSFNDARLNALVGRFAGNPSLAQAPNYNTSGHLKNPLVTLHTLADPSVPYDHEALYGAKVAAAGKSSELAQLPSLRYGHCNVSANEAKAALLLMLLKSAF